MDVADGGVVADGVALIGIGQAGQDVPGRGDDQEKEQPGERLQLPASGATGRSRSRKGTTAAAKKTGAIRPLVSTASASAAHIP